MIKCNKFIYNKSNLNEMEFFMKSLKGLLFIITSFVLTILTWMNTSPQFMIPGLALTSLSLTFILATRIPIIESWFHGLEKVYTVLYFCQHHPCRLFRQIHPIRSLAMDSPSSLPSLYFRTLSRIHDHGQSSPYI